MTALKAPFPYLGGQTMIADHVWRWRARLPERKGERCVVLARGLMNSILVQFADGYLVLTSRYAVSRAKA